VPETVTTSFDARPPDAAGVIVRMDIRREWKAMPIGERPKMLTNNPTRPCWPPFWHVVLVD